MTALIIHESFVKQRQQTLPRCDLFNVTISFLFLFLVLTSSSIIFRKHTIWFLGDAKTCSLALPACRIKIKTCTSFYKSFPHSTLPVAFGSVCFIAEWRLYFYLMTATLHVHEGGRGVKLQTLTNQHLLRVWFICLCEWMKRKTLKRIREFEPQCQMSRLCLRESRRHGFEFDPAVLSALNVYKTFQENSWDMLSLHAPGPARSAEQISRSGWHMCSWTHLFRC